MRRDGHNGGMPQPAGSALGDASAAAEGAFRHQRLLLVAIVLAALNLRTAVTSVGPVLAELRQGLGLSGATAGLLTTLPVLCFAALGSCTAAIARRLGETRTLTGALVIMVVGLVLRALAHSTPAFLVCSFFALSGGALGNVLLPTLVKRHFPHHVGTVTAAYTTALAVGTTVAAAETAPIAAAAGPAGWRWGLAVWAAPALLAVLPWLALLRSPPVPAPRAHAAPAGAAAHISARQLARRPLAWAMALYFGAQSLQAYVAFGWFAQYFREAGLSQERAGYLIAFLSALSIPISMVVPSLAARMRSQRPIVLVLWCCYLVGYLGLLSAPVAGAWAWAFLIGAGSGAFPLALTMIGLRAHTPEQTGALSAFAQGVGYLLAGSGPLLVGALHAATGGWTWPFAIVFAALAVQLVSGWYVGGAHAGEGHARG
jgi:MFS transporter, CP family, cyanate transporter